MIGYFSLKKFFDRSSDIIDAAKNIVNQQEFAEKLDRAGGFIALVGIGIPARTEKENKCYLYMCYLLLS